MTIQVAPKSGFTLSVLVSPASPGGSGTVQNHAPKTLSVHTTEYVHAYYYYHCKLVSYGETINNYNKCHDIVVLKYTCIIIQSRWN